uniref:Uncharacterized protein n=1 Tax=Arundo donax TaxID=35708 RepID=A0A0A9D9T0_ARUDO
MEANYVITLVATERILYPLRASRSTIPKIFGLRHSSRAFLIPLASSMLCIASLTTITIAFKICTWQA